MHLIHGDCLTVLPTLEAGSVDVVVTDPPYGVGLGVGKDTRRGGKHGLAKAQYVGAGDTYEDYLRTVPPAVRECLRIASRVAVFVGPHIWELPKADALGGVYLPCGVGRHAWGFKTFLPVLFYGKAPDLHKGAKSIVLRSTEQARPNGHPCPKPLSWMEWLVQLVSRPGETVLDPFMGSGTTAEACRRTGRNFIGIECVPEYVAIAWKRLAAVEAETPLFAALEAAPAN